MDNLRIKKHQKDEKKIKEWELKDEEVCQIFEKKVQQRISVHHGGWKELSADVLWRLQRKFVV